jgi:CheY-like chemotaxis protein
MMHNILIVDNEPFDLSVLEQMLDEADYRFVKATSGRETRQIITAQKPHLAAILIDWVLPDTDGVELLAWLKSRPELGDVEVIVHSIEFDPAHVEKGIDCGAYYYLTKPFEELQLEAIVRAAISSFELKQRLKEKVKATEDAFRLLDHGRFKFRSIEEAELVSVHIASACGAPDCSVGLRELLVNAVEHGNLEISYEDKGRLLAEQKLDAERRRRLGLAKYKDRFVEVSLQRLPDQMEVTIRDSGNGFDFERFMTIDADRLFDAHGRGVLVASTCLELEYIQPGNHVRVRLPIQDRTSANRSDESR